ncbi:MAG: TIGR00725 family protein [Solirubrobacteraceae bacterium]
MTATPYVAVVGAAQATPALVTAAQAVGRDLALAGAVLLTGGHGGVMAAACRGAASAGGVTVGILPGADRAGANEWVAVAIPTGLGELRNGLIVRAADVVIAVGGAYGTLSEVALALSTGVPVVGLGTWSIDGIEPVDSPQRAVARALELVREVGAIAGQEGATKLRPGGGGRQA